MRGGGRKEEGKSKGEVYNRSEKINHLHFNHTYMINGLLTEEVTSDE